MIKINRLIRFIRRLPIIVLKPVVLAIINKEIRVWGDPKRLKISKKAVMLNTLFNTSSGWIEVGDYTFTGHNVSIITGTHRYESLLEDRMADFPKDGQDIKIGKGVWICSNALILGPCTIGNHSVIAAGSVVLPGSEIPPGTIVAGVPARPIKTLDVSKKLR